MKIWVKRIGIGAGVLVGTLLLVAAGVWTYGGQKDSRTIELPVSKASWMPVSASPELVARGEHLSTAIGKCVECHAADMGGTTFVDDPGLGRIAAPNLTTGRGGVLANYTDEELERAIRHGVRKDGTPLLIMPSEEYQHFTDEDLAAVIAYMRSRPPVDREFPEKQLRFVGRALVTGGIVKHAYDLIDHERVAPARYEPSVSAEYGRYLANVGGCTGCHGPGLSGGPIPGAPPGFKPASNITPGGIGSWTEADFFRALREGIRPSGTPIDTTMPWRLTAKMTDDEIKAVWAFLRTVPAKEYGNR